MDQRVTLEQAGRTLSLLHGWPEQDWGIVNADPHRAQDFAAFYREQAGHFADWAAEFYLGELVLESVNDALRSGQVADGAAQEWVQAILRRLSSPTG